MFFGAGSIDSNPDEPAPVPNRGFFAGRLSMSSFASSSSGRDGNPIVIFLGFFDLGAESAGPVEEDEANLVPEDDDAGGGNDRDDFFVGGGNLDSRDDCGFVGGGEGVLSSPLSASLPYPSTPSMMIMSLKVVVGVETSCLYLLINSFHTPNASTIILYWNLKRASLPPNPLFKKPKSPIILHFFSSVLN